VRSSQTRFQTLFRPLKVNGNAIPTGASALAIFLTEPLAAAINFWPQRFNPSLNAIAPHITVAYSPFMPAFDWPAVRPVLAALLAEFPTFTISLRYTNVFRNPGRVL
jgi:2'-5' RNA ligase